MCELVMIDDNPMEHLIMQTMFNCYGLFPDSAHCLDGRMIIEFLKETRKNPERIPDIIFLDLNMPHFSGWQFLDQFKKLYPSINKDISIYIISSSVDKADRVKAKSYPFVKNFYQKPMKKEEMTALYLSYKNTDRMAS